MKNSRELIHPTAKVTVFLPYLEYFHEEGNAYEKEFSKANIVYYPVDALWLCFSIESYCCQSQPFDEEWSDEEWIDQ